MELFRSENYYIFVRNESSLWWHRTTGVFSVRSAWDLSDIGDIECMGITDGIIGKVDHPTMYEPRLIIIKESSPVGQLYFHHTIHCVKSVCIVNMGLANQELDLLPCTKHGGQNSKDIVKKGPARMFENSAFLNKTVGAVKNVSNTIKTTTQQAATQVKQTVKKQKDPKVAEKFEKRLTDELHKIFTDSESFYYSRTLDLTNSLQRQYEVEKELTSTASDNETGNNTSTRPVTDITRWWKHVDERFFWNKHMLKDIIALGSPSCDEWVLPVIQGCVRLAPVPLLPPPAGAPLGAPEEGITLGLISRRSRHQAGTRYNRRGISADGHVANYVETEQVVSITCSDAVHRVSFVQVRGSVPIFWSQPELKFRPPPRLDRTEEENAAAFKKHFDEELALYGSVCIINLVEQQGRERVIWEAYGDHVMKYNSPDVVYTTFDFHEFCRGMHYENVSVLVDALSEVTADMGYCWRDARGLICAQAGAFRVNCIDCLDRTNVVQTAIAKHVLELQLCRLGLGAPGAGLPPPLRAAFLALWADNGDVVSRQYAGTKALKGDYTRTGERKLTGMMKDGVASANRYFNRHFSDAFRQLATDIQLGQEPDPETIAEFDSLWRDVKMASMVVCGNIEGRTTLDLMPPYFGHVLANELIGANVAIGLGRYYLSTFKDSLRQVAIDVMTGESRTIPEQLIGVDCSPCLLAKDPHVPDAAMAQHVKSLIDDCRAFVTDGAPALGAWGLIDADPGTGDPLETELDRVLVLSRGAYHVADYDDCADRWTAVQRVQLADVTAVQAGAPDAPATLFPMGRKSSPEPVYCIRFHYNYKGESGYFHTFRSTGLRFFNNVAVVINSREEMIESLLSICESLQAARALAGLPPVPFQKDVRLDKRRTKLLPSQSRPRSATSTLYLDLAKLPSLTKNMSETQLVADIRSVGSKALEGMSSQLSRLRLGRARPALHLALDGGARPRKPFSLGAEGAGGAGGAKKGSLSDGPGSDYSSDDEARTNIFEPTLDNFEHSQVYIGKSQPPADDCELVQNPLYSRADDAAPAERTLAAPEITVDPTPGGALQLSHKLSHSSADLSAAPHAAYHVRSTSQHEIALSISQSSSDWCVRGEEPRSPLGRLARGVRSLGANLDPRTIKSPTDARDVSLQREQHRALQQKWSGCSTRLIAL